MRTRSLALEIGFVLAIAVAQPRTASAQSSGSASAHPAAPAHSAASRTPYAAACTAASVLPAESDKAHAIYQAGKVQYDDASYDAAIVLFRDAYKRDCAKHELLVIIARAYELKNDKAEAIRALETYLERVPNAPEASSHRTRIENLRKQLPPPPAPPPAPEKTPPREPSPQAPPVEVREHTALPWVVVGVGAAAMITGGIVYLTAPALPDGCSETESNCSILTGETPAQNEVRKSTAGRSKGQRLGGTITLAGGAALAAIGLLWHFLEPTGPVSRSAAAARAAAPKVTPEIAPGYAGVSFGASF